MARRLMSVLVLVGFVAAGLALALQPFDVVVLDTAHEPRALVQGRVSSALAPRCDAKAATEARAAHVEVFVDGVGVLVPANLGGDAACNAPLRTRDSTGVVRVVGAATLGDLFASWGYPIRNGELLGVRGRVRVYVDGRLRLGPVADVALLDRAQVVVEVGAVVPPHASYAFPA